MEKVPVTCLTKKFSDFHYFFFYAEEPNLSFYSEYSATTEGYQRLFEAGRGSACFERNSKGFSENGIYYKWGGAFIQLDSEDIQALENFLEGKERKFLSVLEKEIKSELNLLLDLDKKISKIRE